ncbi:MAG: potassium channel protein [Aquificae bacterium]|nr:potassium channel protein [Aquificota bacterium]
MGKLKKKKCKLRLRRKKPKRLIDIYEEKLLQTLYLLRLPLLMLHTVMTIGTLGYMILSDGDFINSLYMTVITVGTIGYGEVVRGSDTPVGRIFTTFLALGGIGVFTTSVTILVRIFFQEDFIRNFRAWKMLRDIEKLRGHYILAGFNKTTLELINLLRKRKIPYVVVDSRREVERQLKELGIKYYIIDEPYKRIVLDAAGIHRAQGLVVNLGDDARNIAVIVTARLMRPSKEDFFIFSFASTEETAQKLEELGANKAIVPHRLLATRLAAYIFHTSSAYISDLFDRIAFGEETDIDILEIPVPEDSPLVGKKLKEIDLRRSLNVTVIAIRKPDGRLDITITGDTVIEPGDTLILFGHPKNLKKAQKILLSRMEVRR